MLRQPHFYAGMAGGKFGDGFRDVLRHVGAGSEKIGKRDDLARVFKFGACK